MPFEMLSYRDRIGCFADEQPLRAALLLTYALDGERFEDWLAPEIFSRWVDQAVLVRDRHALKSNVPSLRCTQVDAVFSSLFHPKLMLLVAQDRALALIGSANLTRGGFERNLELGHAFELSPEGGARTVFRNISSYLQEHLVQELRGDAIQRLDEVRRALDDVVGGVPDEPQVNRYFLHNYRRPLWDQILDLLPHRHIRRALIMSPYFEAADAGDREDPPAETRSPEMFERMFADLRFDGDAETPVWLCFRNTESSTLPPLAELRRWHSLLRLRPQSSVSSADARPLHAKMIVLEGERPHGRDPFVLVISGSPNFTPPALLRVPPDGNSEIAVVTRLSPKRNAFAAIAATLRIDELFAKECDWDSITPAVVVQSPPEFRRHMYVACATLCVARQELAVTFVDPVPGLDSISVNGGTPQRVSIGANGVLLAGSSLIGKDESTGLICVNATAVEVSGESGSGGRLFCESVPLNVDCPDQFHRTLLMGAAFQTLDQRIAAAAAGQASSYREKEEELEGLRNVRQAPDQILSPAYEADLDRFWRNTHHGLAALRQRLEQNKGSEFTCRNTIRSLLGFCEQAARDGDQPLPREWRLHLLGRLAADLGHIAASHAVNTTGLGEYVRAIDGPAVFERVQTWLEQLAPPLDKEARPHIVTFERLIRQFGTGGGAANDQR